MNKFLLFCFAFLVYGGIGGGGSLPLAAYPLFYLTPHSTPDHLVEKVLFIPMAIEDGGPPIITNRLSLALDPELDPEEALSEVTQFHTQDALGKFIYGFHSPDQVRMESRDHDGSVRGSYSYVDPNGMTVKMEYWDEGKGFQVRGSGLPRYTPEVAAAREEHFRLYKEALAVAAAVADDSDNDQQDLVAAENPNETNKLEEEIGIIVGDAVGQEEEGILGGDWSGLTGGVESGQGVEGDAEKEGGGGFINPWVVGAGEDEGEEGEEAEEEDDTLGLDNPDFNPENLSLTRFWAASKRVVKPNRVNPKIENKNAPSFEDYFNNRIRSRRAAKAISGNTGKIYRRHLVPEITVSGETGRRHLIPAITGPFVP